MKLNLPKLTANMDSAKQVFAERELEYVRKKVYSKKYGKLKARTLLPVSYEVPSFAKTHTYKMFSHFGVMQLIQSYADNLPVSTVGMEEFTAKVCAYGTSYEYNTDDIDRANATGTPLNSEQAFACRRAWEQLLEQVAWKGDTTAGLVGLVYHPNVTVAQATTGGWATATAQQIYTDMVQAWNTVFSATNGEEEINTLLISANQFPYAKNKILYDNKTVLTVFKENFPEVTVDYLTAINTVTPRPSGLGGTVNCMIGYVKQEDYIALEIPEEFKQHAPQVQNLAYKTNTTGKTAGITLRYPLSVVVVEGI